MSKFYVCVDPIQHTIEINDGRVEYRTKDRREYVLNGHEIAVRVLKGPDTFGEIVFEHAKDMRTVHTNWITPYFVCTILPLDVNFLHMQHTATQKARQLANKLSDGASSVSSFLSSVRRRVTES